MAICSLAACHHGGRARIAPPQAAPAQVASFALADTPAGDLWLTNNGAIVTAAGVQQVAAPQRGTRTQLARSKRGGIASLVELEPGHLEVEFAHATSLAPLALLATSDVRLRSMVWRGNTLWLAGEFAGTLRIGATTLTSGGGQDGFIAAVAEDGTVQAARFGDDGQDGVSQLAVYGDVVYAVATFVGRAQLGAHPFESSDETGLQNTGVLLALRNPTDVIASATFAADGELAVAGLAATAAGNIGVALTARGHVLIAGTQRELAGPADAVLLRFTPRCALVGIDVLGASDYDGASALAADARGFWLSGWCSGGCTAGSLRISGPDGNAAFIAHLPANGGAIDQAFVLTSADHEWIGPVQTRADGSFLARHQGRSAGTLRSATTELRVAPTGLVGDLRGLPLPLQ